MCIRDRSLELADDVALSFRILTGYDGDTPKWQEVAIGGNGVTPWQNWTFSYAGGTYSLTGNGGAGQTSQSLILTAPPMADSGVGQVGLNGRYVGALGQHDFGQQHIESRTEPGAEIDDVAPVPGQHPGDRRDDSGSVGAVDPQGEGPVSYTHLDVYKRQLRDQ